MTFAGRRSIPPQKAVEASPKLPKRLALPPPDADPAEAASASPDGLPMPSLGQDIPPHVWQLLQQAGEAAALRLVQIIQSPRFASYAPSAQRGLIELALTRAYGLPIRRALNLNLSSGDADAVAASLADLAANLPETARRASPVDVTPQEAPTLAEKPDPS